MWGTNLAWTVSSQWTAASTMEETYQRSCSEYDQLDDEVVHLDGKRWMLSSLFAFFFFVCFFQNLYDSIKNEPFKIPEDDGNDLTHTFFNPDREGWLLKLGELCQQGRRPSSFSLTSCPPVADKCSICYRELKNTFPWKNSSVLFSNHLQSFVLY